MSTSPSPMTPAQVKVTRMLPPIKIAQKRLRQTRLAAHKLAQSLGDLGMCKEQMHVVEFVKYLFVVALKPSYGESNEKPCHARV